MEMRIALKLSGFLLAIFMAHQTCMAASGNIVVKGSTTVLPVVQAEAEAFMKKYPAINISLSGGGSGDGIKAIIDKTTDIANSSRELRPEEISLARTKGLQPITHSIAVDAIVPVVHPQNKVRNLTIDQLSQIYQGKIRNWKDVGGDNLPIIVVSRDSSSGTFETWRELVLHKTRVTPRAQMQTSSGAIVQVVSKNKHAIGYIGMGYIDKTTRALSVDGVEATVATAVSGKYPIARHLYMVTNGTPKGNTASFIRFILSGEGQKIVEEVGFVPVKPAAKKK
jgi:phosphate transport system substrate-binding protein